MKLIPSLAPLDHQAIHTLGIPSLLLMESAGQQVAQSVVSTLQAEGIPLETASVVVVCGPGNNGGDGFVCARTLTTLGVGEIQVIRVSPANAYQGDAALNNQLLVHYPVNVTEMVTAPSEEMVTAMPDVVVDALFGNGLSRPITGHYADWITWINGQPCPVIAVDLPSGVSGETGQVMGTAVFADQTVTFAAGKPGLYLAPGKYQAGQVKVVDIGLPPILLEKHPSGVHLITQDEVAMQLPVHSPVAHKYMVGSLLVLAGSATMPGAAQLCCEAALNSGVGLVTLAAPTSVFATTSIPPEVIRCPLPENGHGEIVIEAWDALITAMAQRKISAVALGPGLGSSLGVLSVVEKLLSHCHQEQMPVVIDADGLAVLAFLAHQGRLPEVRDWLGDHCVLTPHLGEAAKLLQQEAAVVTADLLTSATTGRTQYGGVFVLKSATTLVADTNDQLWINPTGNVGLATAGSGDVLTGLIGSLLAQGLLSSDAAKVGVYLHGLAGDLLKIERCTAGVTAGQLAHNLPLAFQAVQAT